MPECLHSGLIGAKGDGGGGNNWFWFICQRHIITSTKDVIFLPLCVCLSVGQQGNSKNVN